jgi:hypothetical protein
LDLISQLTEPGKQVVLWQYMYGSADVKNAIFPSLKLHIIFTVMDTLMALMGWKMGVKL